MFEDNNGRVYVYFGGPDLSTTPDLTITGSAEDVEFGTSLSLVGDVNGDGFDDLLAGALSTTPVRTARAPPISTSAA